MQLKLNDEICQLSPGVRYSAKEFVATDAGENYTVVTAGDCDRSFFLEWPCGAEIPWQRQEVVVFQGQRVRCQLAGVDVRADSSAMLFDLLEIQRIVRVGLSAVVKGKRVETRRQTGL